ncbi:serine/threonine-protein phosphatase [Saccharopolyspora sp. K220]|uniref:PP2C family protein-serine/threonine phosphatase n=1 Tax=Saccharopolyspora soli TaxID=2926618 RepID=UPI001F576BDC|nr:PP2C family protein-serine/threonine phosphatase [Saccharopolyspora soli]MCI2423434.1 serine/threonine-protein phosphatase [Saccharopolyspora soli]
MVTVPTRLESIDCALRNAPAHELPEKLVTALGHYFGVAGLEIYLVDLRLAVLEPVLEPEGPGIPLVATLEGRVFCDQVHVQQPLDHEVALHLPLTVRGDRLGVLWLRIPEAPDEATREELAAAAELAAHAIMLAEVATDRYQRARRPQRLTLAAEMQWQLLPVRSVDCASYRLAGQLEPAYAVRGDNFDWAQDIDSLTVAVTNGMGESTTAAMLTTLAITALRNARRSGANLATQAALADQAIWAHHAGTQHVSTLLMQIDLNTGEVGVIDAGSPRLWRVREEGIEQIELDAQLPLGMVDGTDYDAQHFQLEPGDRLFVLTDGIYDAVLADRNYSTAALRRALHTSLRLSPAEAVRSLLSDLRAFLQDSDLDDDAVAVCVDWIGPHDGEHSAAEERSWILL